MIVVHLLQSVFNSLWGNIIWHLIRFMHSQSDCFLILYNTKDNESVTNIVMRYLQEYMAKQHVEKAIIIYSPKYEYVQIPEGIESVPISRLNLTALCDYYSLCDISANAILCDLTHAKGRDGMDLEGVRGITLEQIVRVGLLNL